MAAFAHDGVDLHYEVHGRGRPLLLIAGLAADNAFWLPVLDTFAKTRQVIVFDNRGCGRTAPLDAGSSIRTMADDTMALVRYLELSKVDIVGHSMGGMIAIECAVHYPDLVDHLVLAATGPVNSARNNALFGTWVQLFGTIDRATWFRNLFHWVLTTKFFDNATTAEALVQLAAGYPYQQTTVSFRNQVAAIATFDATAALPTIRARTLVLAGAQDLLFPLASSVAFANTMPRATFAAIDESAHSIPNEFPAAFTRHVLDFLPRA